MGADASGTTPLGGEVHATELSQPYWKALRAGDFALQRCRSCARRQHYPRVLCRFCGSTVLDWAGASRSGTVVAAVLTHRSSKRALRPQLPYSVVLVRMADGPVLLATTAARAPVPQPGIRVEIDAAETLRRGALVVAAPGEGRP